MNTEEIINMLNKDRANELIAILQYMNHHYCVMGENFLAARDWFKDLGIIEMTHAEKLAERINALGGNPVSKSDDLKKYTDLSVQESGSLKDMVMANLDYEQKAINDYSEHIANIGQNDPVTTRILEEILAQEEEHASDLQAWMGQDEMGFKLRSVG